MIKLLNLLCCLLFLVGCQNNQVEKEKVKMEVEVEPTFYERNVKPRGIYINDAKNDMRIDLPLLSYCWNPDLTKCLSELNEAPKQDIFDGYRTIRNQPKEQIQVEIITLPEDISNPDEKLPFATTIELFQVEADQFIPTELIDNKFVLPSEEGIYTYVLKLTYEKEYKGIAFYAWQTRVGE
ncbi:hypothetical protein [Metasolibacillus sp. FSL K6-0083]|uniref:hypothetical protein n=1 Tax=Metasolibacillus sp. FSL K6-0083 TaxID=2921416 RepID=UPI003159D1F2